MTETELRDIVMANTHPGRHRDEALKMVETHKARFAAEIKMILCHTCGDTLKAVRWTDKQTGGIVDSWGYMEFDKEVVCHRCLNEGYIGDIYVPKGARG
jgi:uncharacterized protein with PIN domain